MNCSLNEVEATVRKAVRAVGYSWGIAEEGGKSVRWLCSHGFDGCAVIRSLLDTMDRVDVNGSSPIVTRNTWHAASGILCPLLTGAALSDRAFDLAEGELSISQIAEPALLLYFIAGIARYRQLAVSINWHHSHLEFSGPDLRKAELFLSDHAVNSVVVRLSEVNSDERVDRLADAPARSALASAPAPIPHPISDAIKPTASRADVVDADWQRMNTLAARTYAPATEESRQKGAGAGTTDND